MLEIGYGRLGVGEGMASSFIHSSSFDKIKEMLMHIFSRILHSSFAIIFIKKHLCHVIVNVQWKLDFNLSSIL